MIARLLTICIRALHGSENLVKGWKMTMELGTRVRAKINRVNETKSEER